MALGRFRVVVVSVVAVTVEALATVHFIISENISFIFVIIIIIICIRFVIYIVVVVGIVVIGLVIKWVV